MTRQTSCIKSLSLETSFCKTPNVMNSLGIRGVGQKGGMGGGGMYCDFPIFFTLYVCPVNMTQCAHMCRSPLSPSSSMYVYFLDSFLTKVREPHMCTLSHIVLKKCNKIKLSVNFLTMSQRRQVVCRNTLSLYHYYYLS